MWWYHNALFLFIAASPMVLHNVVTRYKEYVETSTVRVCTGTWNVNGGKHFRSIAFKHQSMNDWLLDAPKILAESGSGKIFPTLRGGAFRFAFCLSVRPSDIVYCM